MKRFWDAATVGPASAGGFAVLLDGKPMHLPGGAVLRVEAEALAHAIAAEWREAGGGRGGEMSFADTPLTRLAGTAQERVAPDPMPTVAALTAYAESDLLCYRAEAPPALAQRQAQQWQPWLDWAALALDAPLRVTSGIIKVPQQPGAIAAVRAALAASPATSLTGLAIIIPALGSAVLGLAIAAGRLAPSEACELAMLDELFQAGFWGDDPEAAARRQLVAADVASAARFMELGRG